MAARVPPIAYCPSCGAAKEGPIRFCTACAHDFWGAAAGRDEAAASIPSTSSGTTESFAWYRSVPRAVRSVVGGAALIVLGSLLPWLTISSVDGSWQAFSGVQGGGDGWITLAIGLGIGTLAVIGRDGASEFNRVAVALLSLVALLVFWINLGRVGGAASTFDGQAFGYATASVSVGLWLIAIGAVVAFGFNVARAGRSGPGTLPSIIPWR
jgi:hypothetical protein